MSRAVATLVSVVLLAGCAGAESGADDAQRSVGWAATKLPRMGSIAMPIAAPRDASDFGPGDDQAFLRSLRKHLESQKKKTTRSDEELVQLGRAFCSVLSGGGLLAVKTDFFAGFHQLVERRPRIDGELFHAAFDTFCPEYQEGYTRIRVGPPHAEPTAAESADLVRFVVSYRFPQHRERVNALGEVQLAQAGARLCTIGRESGWSRRKPAERLVRGLPEEIQVMYLLGLALAYCEDEAEAIQNELVPAMSA